MHSYTPVHDANAPNIIVLPVPIINPENATMHHLDKQPKIEHNRNKYLQLHLHFAVVIAFTQPIVVPAVGFPLIFYFTSGGPFGLPYKIVVMLPMSFDAHKFLHHMETLDLSEDQKLDIIHSVATMVESIVDSSFGEHPVQDVLAKSSEQDSLLLNGQVKSRGNILTLNFKEAAKAKGGRKKNDKQRG